MICIGGSLGSIEVIHDLLAWLPSGHDVPVMIAIHRHAGSQETLSRMLHSSGDPGIVEPFDKNEISNGAVYLAPPDYHMMVDGRSIALSSDQPEHFARPSIDILFQSVARAYGPDCLGVILSGASDDGARGLRDVHDRGGGAIVQDPKTAKAATLPLAALNSVPSARVLSVPQIGRFFRDYCLRRSRADE